MGTTTQFSTQGYVYIYTVLSWKQEEGVTGLHKRQYKWYANGELLLSSRSDRFRIRKPPYYLWNWKPTIAFGEGRHSVELYIDEQLVVRHEFTVSDSDRRQEYEL